MKQFHGLEVKKAAGRELLPAGGYVARVLDAKEMAYDWGSVVVLSFDIESGPYQGFFKRGYQNQEGEDKKWRGVYRLSVPKDDGSEKDSWTKRTFGNAIWALEDSNPGYHFNWDESTFKNKMVGVLFRNREWELNGKTGWTTECCALSSVQDIRENAFKIPKDKPLPPKASAGAASFADDGEDLPF